MSITREHAVLLDQQDPLWEFRNEFYTREREIYLDGNSLGLLSKRAEQSVLDCIEDWKNYGIDGWMNGKYPWFTLSEQLGGQLASLIGAKKGEVVVTGSTTVNLHQLAATFYKPSDSRKKILADELTFPSDIYALKSLLELKGMDPENDLIRVKSRDGRFLDEQNIIDAMMEDVALIILPSVLYRSGQLLDMKRLTKEAHSRGICIGFDLCHSIGAIPHSLHEWDVDFAFWCNYKYLNSGPGSVAGLYINQRLNDKPALSGWFGSNKEKQFDMSHTFIPAEGAGAFQIGTPHLLSTAPLIGSLQIFQEASLESIRLKSLKLTRFLMDLIHQELSPFAFTIGTPDLDEKRGGHVSLEHPEAARICKSLKELGVIPDFRSPNVIRLAPVALYISFTEVFDAVGVLKEIMETKHYEKFQNTREVIA